MFRNAGKGDGDDDQTHQHAGSDGRARGALVRGVRRERARELRAALHPDNIGAPLAADLIAVGELGAGERVLDVACGTGIVAQLAAEHVGPTGIVAGLDINPGMLAVARSMTPQGVAIDWREGSAESLPFAGSEFDAVFCQLGLQFFSDKAAALREMRRVVAPDGRVLVSTSGPIPSSSARSQRPSHSM